MTMIDRNDAADLIPEEEADQIIKDAVQSSLALSRFRTVRMGTSRQNMPVLSAFPFAYFVDGEANNGQDGLEGLKTPTKMAWDNKYLYAQEIATIVPVPEAVLDDARFDIWGEVRPFLAEAVGRTLDAAVFFGANAPAVWPDAVIPSAIEAGNVYGLGINDASEGGIAEDINQTMAFVEADGFDVTAFVADRAFRARLRGARASDGQRLLDVTNNTVDGLPVQFAMPGLWDDVTVGGDDYTPHLIAADWEQFVLGLRQDMTYKILDQAVITDAAGNIIYNLAQQDMVALRLVMRVAWQVANPLTHANDDDATRYPAAVLAESDALPATP